MNATFYASLRAWILLNYEVQTGGFVLVEDILNHATSEKENIGTTISSTILTKAINEIFLNEVRKCRIRRGKKIRVWGFSNMCKKDVNFTSEQLTYEEEWIILQTNTDKISRAIGSSKWTVMSDKETTSFLHLEELRFDAQIAVCEVNLQKNHLTKTIDVRIQYHERIVPNDKTKDILKTFKNCSIVETTINLLKMMERSYVCPGLEICDEELYGVPMKKYKISSTMVGGEDIAKSSVERGFAPGCEIITNSAGTQCYSCRCTKDRLKHKKARKEERMENAELSNKTNHRYMSREQLQHKIEKEKKKHQQEEKLREKFEKEMLEMESQDHEDLKAMMNKVKKEDIPEDMLLLWEQQQKILGTTAKSQYRWHPSIMKLCVELYSKNPHVLDPLRKFIYLPSNRTIRCYKNKVDQKPGWHPNMLKWCLDEAKKKNLTEQDYWGAFVLDEMKIQEDIQMVVKGGKHRLVGFVDLGKVHDDMELLSGKSDEPKLATHVLQFIFLSDRGFRFPIAQFPSSGCTASTLYFIFWEGVRKMLETGFTIYYCILDGAEVNRQFIKIHFTDEQDIIDKKFMCQNVYNGLPMVLLMDPKHNFKKLRNNILKSSVNEPSPRCLTVGGKHILWEHLLQSFNYDQGEFSMSLHHKLTADHFELNPASKMRNHLAEDVLDKNMLELVKAYREHLQKKPGQDATSLDSTIELLTYSSNIIQMFHDKLPITSTLDHRLSQLSSFLSYMQKWKISTNGNAKHFVSQKLDFDLQSMVYGFRSLVAIKFKYFNNAIIKPAITNQDVVENHFCQVRACNGQNSNPTWRLQEAAQNSIRYGQTTISRKSNAGRASLPSNSN